MRRITLLLICGYLGAAAYVPAQDDVVMKAMRDELDRSLKQLRLQNLDKPYFIAYRVSEQTRYNIAASLGSLTGNQQSRARLLSVEVRVGDYALDDTNFLSPRFGPAGVVRGFGNTVQLPLEDDYKEIRRQIWLATDAAYKKALEALAQKRAALENKTRSDDLPDLSKEEPTTSFESPASLNMDPGRAEDLVRQLSALLRSMPEIHRCDVAIEASSGYIRYLNSEGTEYTRAAPYVGLIARTATQAPDGMPLSDSLAVYGHSMNALPAQDQLAAQLQEMGRRLVELRSAPLVERYNGPVLFEGQASAEIFSQEFAPKLIASRHPITGEPQFEMFFSRTASPLQDRLGARVLPAWASVTDDPTAREAKEVALVGGYAVDDDGVRARRTVVVENGVLKTLLVSRDPVRGIPRSTGNVRGFGVAPSNLFFNVQGGLTDAALRQKLLSLAQQRGEPYAIVVRRLRNPWLGNPTEMAGVVLGQFLPGLGGGSSSAGDSAVLAYEVFPDGREKLVRNARFEGIDASSFKDLVAASAGQTVYSTPFLDFKGMVVGLLSGGALPAESDPPIVSLVVPDLLFEDVSVVPPSGEVPKPPLSQPPSGR